MVRMGLSTDSEDSAAVPARRVRELSEGQKDRVLSLYLSE